MMGKKTMREKLGWEVGEILRDNNYSQQQISEILNLDQAEVSKLVNKKYELFSEGRLIKFIELLGKRVVFVVLDKDEPTQQPNEAVNGVRVVYDMFMRPHLEIDGEII